MAGKDMNYGNNNRTIKENDDMSSVELELFGTKLEKSFEEKLAKMQESMEKTLKNIQEGQTCKDGVCFAEKLDEVCNDVSCMKKIIDKDDMVECPNENCKHMFSLLANTVNDTIVCPNCQAISTLD